MVSGGCVQGIEAVQVGRYARFPVFQEDDGLGERLTALRIADIAGDDDAFSLGLCRNGQEDEEDRTQDATHWNHFSVRALAADWPAR